MINNSIIGVDLGATNVRVGKVKDGKIVKLEAERINKSNNPDALLDQIIKMIESVKGSETAGIGVGVPSVVDVKTGTVYDVLNIPSWKEVPLKAIFEKHFNKPVAINNDANCFALGETYFGKASGYNSVIGLILGTGFAAGLVLNGHLYNGKHCGAGEIGMIAYQNSIYEYYCSAQFFEKEFSLNGIEVFRKAQNGDDDALNMYRAYGKHLGNGLKMILYAYDPEIIVFGGSVRHAFPYFKESMLQSLHDFSFPRNLESLQIKISNHENIAVLGAAAIAMESITLD